MMSSLRFRFIAAFVVLVACVLLSRPTAVFAGSACDTAKGTCYSAGQCEILKLEQPGVTSESADCDTADDPDDNGDVCCILSTQLPAAASCTDSNGSCMAECGANDENIGLYDCTEGKWCCRTKTSVTATPGNAATAKDTSGSGAPQGIVPGDVYAKCFKGSDLCTLDDIVKTGVGFANFLMGLSGALFLIIFIYGGALYLLSFGDKTRVEKGTKAIKGAAFGMIIVLSAWTIVAQIVKGITGTTGAETAVPTGSDAKCLAQGSAWSCHTFEGATVNNVQQAWTGQSLDCKTNLCPGDFHTVCCKTK
ncbi:MAG: pilin [Patescibacteria group bacterium]